MAATSWFSVASPAALRPASLSLRGSGLEVMAVGVCGGGVSPVWSGNLGFAVGKARTTVIAASTGKGSTPEPKEMDDFSCRLEDMRRLYALTLRAVGADAGAVDEFAQSKLETLAVSSVDLALQVAGRLKPQVGSALHKGLWETSLKFTGVAESARAKLAPWGFVNALCNDLEGLRALVSSATNTPLPGLIRETALEEMETATAQVALLALLEARYAAVEADIKVMLA